MMNEKIKGLINYLKEKPWISIGLILTISAVIKYLYIFEVHPLEKYIFSDMMAVKTRAMNFVLKLTTPYDSLNPPAEHLLTVISWSLFAGKYTMVKMVHLLCSVMTMILVYQYSKNFLGRNISLATTFIFAFHYPALTLSGLLLPETVFTTMLAILCYLIIKTNYPWNKKDAISIGLVIGLSLWWKGNLIFFVPLLMLWQIFHQYRSGASRKQIALFAIKSWSPLLLTIATIIASLSFYHWNFNKKFTLIASQSGFVFTSATCPERITSDKNGFIFQSPTYTQLSENERIIYDHPFHDSLYFWKRGFKCMTQNPLVLFTKLRHIHHLFMGVELWPSNQTIMLKYLRWYQNIFNFLLLPGILIGLLLSFSQISKPRFLPILLSLSIFVLATIFPMEIRYRIPFDVIFIPLSVWGWREIMEKIFAIHSSTRQQILIIGIWFVIVVAPFLINFSMFL